MKRMKKKVVAMVTLAMFVMTLLPMAAFALPEKYIDASQSTVKVTPTTSVEVNENITVTVDLKEAAKDINDAAYNNLYVWFESEDGEVYKQVNMEGENARIDGNSAVAFNKDGDTVVSFTKAGTYELKAGVSDVSADKVIDTAKELTPVAIENSTIEVTDQVTEVTGIAVDKSTAPDSPEKIVADGVTRNIITATVNTAKVVPGTVLKISNSAANSGVYFVDTTGKAVTEYPVPDTKKVELLLVADKGAWAGIYEIELACGDKTAKLYVEVPAAPGQTDNKAATIEAGEVNKTFVKDDQSTEVKDVKFVVKNAAGESINAVEPFAADVKQGSTVIFAHDKFLTVEGPAKVDVSKVTFKWDSNEKAMVMNCDTNFAKVFNKAGKYTITATLLNGQKASVSFNVVDKVGDLAKIEIVPTKANEKLLINDKTGAKFTVVGYDKDGLAVSLDNVTDGLKIAYTPVAKAVTLDTAASSGVNGVVKATCALDKVDEVLGTKVDVLAVYTDKAGKTYTAEHQYTIVDEAQYDLVDYALKFDKTAGPVLKYNGVTATVEAAEGKTLNVQKVYANLLSQTNKDAKVQVSVDDKNNIVIYSDKDTSVDVQVIALAQTSANNASLAKFAGTLTYKIGAPTPEETQNTTVVMTFGSNEMIVNNEVVTIDKAAPFAQDNRTFVPFRALGEALGAKVEYVAADNTVTYSLGKTEIVMTLGSKDYTVNGEKKTMDVAPFAKEGRTYVPVRFVGEALGFTVTALQNGAGQYVGVAFTK